MMDLSQGLAFVRPMRISAGSYADLVDAEVIVICAGVSQRPGQTRMDLLKTKCGRHPQHRPQGHRRQSRRDHPCGDQPG